MTRIVNTGNLYMWVKWAPNLAPFAALSAPFAPTLDKCRIPALLPVSRRQR